MMNVILHFLAVALFLVSIEAGRIPVQRGQRQLGGFNPFGPSRGPSPYPGSFVGPEFIQGDFFGFGPPRSPSSNFGPPQLGFGPLNQGDGLSIPPRSGNIIPREATFNRQRQLQLQRMQQQLVQQQQLQQQQWQQQQEQQRQQPQQQLQQPQQQQTQQQPQQPQQLQQQTQQQPQQQQQQPNRNSPAFRTCLANCPTTNEYNPVCGNDRQDYYNEQRLLCANRCGMNVQTVRRGTCSNNR